MPKSATRRQVLTSAAASSGLLFTSGLSQAAPKGKSHHPEFLSPWSPPLNQKKDLTTGTTPVRLACSAYRLPYSKDTDITAMVKGIRDKGYTSAGFGAGLFNRNPWLDAPESAVRELKAALKQYDVTFFDMHSVCNLIHPDLDERRKIQRWFIEQMEAAERVGCPMVTAHVGSMAPGAVHPHPDNWTKECWDLGVREVRRIIKDTSGMKCVLSFEPDSLVQVNNPWACRQLVDDCGPRAQICLDPVNMSNLEYHYRKTEYINACFDLLSEDIFCCHAKDIKLENSLQPMLVQTEPGTGTMDYETYLARLSRLNHTRTLLLEHLPEEKYPGVKQFIETTAANVGVTIYT